MKSTGAEIVRFPNRAKRARQAQPIPKLRALELVHRLISEKQLHQIDLNVLQYLIQISSKETGWAVVEYATIGKRIGRSRTTAVRSVQRLLDANIIERQAQRKGKRCYASGYRLVDPLAPYEPKPHRKKGATAAPFSAAEKGAAGANDDIPRCTDAPTPVHQCTTSRAFNQSLFPGCSVPQRGGGAEMSPWSDTEWNEAAEWLARHGKYVRWGPGPGEAFGLAKDDLIRWRRQSGDRVVMAALDRAKRGNGGSGWFGDYLIERLDEILGNGRSN